MKKFALSFAALGLAICGCASPSRMPAQSIVEQSVEQDDGQRHRSFEQPDSMQRRGAACFRAAELKALAEANNVTENIQECSAQQVSPNTNSNAHNVQVVCSGGFTAVYSVQTRVTQNGCRSLQVQQVR